MKITLRVWRQRHARAASGFVRYTLDDVSPEATLLEALDGLNERLAASGEPPVAFDSDCREGICGMCGLMINGIAHGCGERMACRCPRRRVTSRWASFSNSRLEYRTALSG